MSLWDDRIAVEQYNQNRFLSVQTILLPCSQDSVFQCCTSTRAKKCFLSSVDTSEQICKL